MDNAKHQFLNLGCIIYKIKHQSPPTFNTLQPHWCSQASYTPVVNNVDVAIVKLISLLCIILILWMYSDITLLCSSYPDLGFLILIKIVMYRDPN